MAILQGLLGKETRRQLVQAAWPPALAWVRGAMRLSLAVPIWLAGYPHIAQIVAVLAVVNLLAAVELQIAKVILSTGMAFSDLVRKRRLPAHLSAGTPRTDRASVAAPFDTAQIKRLESEDPEEAERQWQSAIAARPQTAGLRVHYADFLARLDRPREALQQISVATDLQPAQPFYLARRAQYQTCLGMFSDAAASYEQALGRRQDPRWQMAADELRRWIDSGNRSPEATVHYYDAVYSSSDRYLFENSPYQEVWERIVDLIPVGAKVLDIGCGPGQFAKFLLQRQQNDYVGLDFSAQAISLAEKTGLKASFYRQDFFVDDFPACDVIVCTDVLEHITNDIGLLAKLPKGKTAICSVPSFYSFGHLRTFADESAIRERYGYAFGRLTVERFSVGPGRYVFLFGGPASAASARGTRSATCGEAGQLPVPADFDDHNCSPGCDGTRTDGAVR